MAGGWTRDGAVSEALVAGEAPLQDGVPLRGGRSPLVYQLGALCFRRVPSDRVRPSGWPRPRPSRPS